MEKHIKYLPMLLFSVLSLKLMINQPSINDALVLFILGLFSAYSETKMTNKKLKHVEDELIQLKTDLKSKNKEIEEVKTLLGGLKLGQTLRNNQQNRI